MSSLKELRDRALQDPEVLVEYLDLLLSDRQHDICREIDFMDKRMIQMEDAIATLMERISDLEFTLDAIVDMLHDHDETVH